MNEGIHYLAFHDLVYCFKFNHYSSYALIHLNKSLLDHIKNSKVSRLAKLLAFLSVSNIFRQAIFHYNMRL